MGGGRNFGDVDLRLSANCGGAKEVAFYGKRVAALVQGFVEREFVARAIGGHGCAHLCVALVEPERGGFHCALVLCQVEVYGGDVVGIHHARGCYVGIGQRDVLLRLGRGHHAVVVAARARNGHVLQLYGLHRGCPSLAGISVFVDEANR